MNKDEFIRHIANTEGCTLVTAAEIVNSFIEGLMSTMTKNNKVVLVGFGAFQVSAISARIGYNTHTKQKIKIPPSNELLLRMA